MKKLIVIFTICLFSCMEKEYIKFQPIILKNDSIQVDKAPIEKSFYTRLEKVLQFYKEDYQTNDKKEVLVPVEIWNNKDLMWNYTTKARSKKWLEEHLE